MRKISIFCCFMAVVALAVLASPVSAYMSWSVNSSGTGNCAGCHGDFRAGPYNSLTGDDPANWGTDLMSGHRTTYGISCAECHSPSGNNAGVYLNPASDPQPDSDLGCTGCHGRVEDAGADQQIGDGLRAHHAAAGVTICAGCHPTDAVQVGEHVPPATYAALGIDPCNEDGGDLTITGNYGNVGLDNDGDGLREPDDPDCAAGPVCGDGTCDPNEDQCTCAADCGRPPANEMPNQTCNDGVDNDCDTFTDCDDPGCGTDPACRMMEVCNDGMDNDGDGRVDCDDPDCSTDPACPTMKTGCLFNPPSDHTDCEDGCRHAPGKEKPFTNGCTDCHGANLMGDFGPSCFTCHGPEWDEKAMGVSGCVFDPGPSHTDREDGCLHAPGKEKPFTKGCTDCHGTNLMGDFGPSCFTCHGPEWDEKPMGTSGCAFNPPGDHTDSEDGCLHAPGKEKPFSNGCTDCHGAHLMGDFGPSCYTCHGMEWDEKSVGMGCKDDRDDESRDDHDERSEDDDHSHKRK